MWGRGGGGRGNLLRRSEGSLALGFQNPTRQTWEGGSELPSALLPTLGGRVSWLQAVLAGPR